VIAGDSAGGNLALEEWKKMNHVFQAYGSFTPQSKEALKRIGEVIQQAMSVQKRGANTV
jgi:acetyl esterase/lipase